MECMCTVVGFCFSFAAPRADRSKGKNQNDVSKCVTSHMNGFQLVALLCDRKKTERLSCRRHNAYSTHTQCLLNENAKHSFPSSKNYQYFSWKINSGCYFSTCFFSSFSGFFSLRRNMFFLFSIFRIVCAISRWSWSNFQFSYVWLLPLVCHRQLNTSFWEQRKKNRGRTQCVVSSVNFYLLSKSDFVVTFIWLAFKCFDRARPTSILIFGFVFHIFFCCSNGSAIWHI